MALIALSVRIPAEEMDQIEMLARLDGVPAARFAASILCRGVRQQFATLSTDDGVNSYIDSRLLCELAAVAKLLEYHGISDEEILAVCAKCVSG